MQASVTALRIVYTSLTHGLKNIANIMYHNFNWHVNSTRIRVCTICSITAAVNIRQGASPALYAFPADSEIIHQSKVNRLHFE